MNCLNDEKTITAIRNRDENAIGEVIEKYSRLLWTVADAVLGSVGTVQDIEDCVAEAFIFLWEHPEKYEPCRGRLKTWLSVVVRSRAIDRCRQLTKHGTVPLDDRLLLEQLDVPEDILRIETRQVLTEAIDALREPDREILIRRYYYGQKPRQIALALNMSVRQVDNRLYQTRLRLRKKVID